MKKLFVLAGVFLLITAGTAEAEFISGSTGADGPFNPTENTVLQVPPDGIFNYTTVNVPSGVTITFLRNAANIPVYILATGDVVINGTISVSGGSATNTLAAGIGGPGGFDGGYGGGTTVRGGNGLGPGGGGGGYTTSYYYSGGGGGYGTAGSSYYSSSGAGGTTYGNSRIMPLIGGSGGGGSTLSYAYGGGGGGGAVLIASSGKITIGGSVTSNGGNAYSSPYAGGGSGGAIKLMANELAGGGSVLAKGGTPRGGAGRIRLEANINNIAASDPPYTYGLPGSVFVADSPSLAIISIAGTVVPANPTGSYAQPDLMLPNTTTNPVAVEVTASNIPVGTAVTVSAIPQYGDPISATAVLSGTDTASSASASVDLSTAYSNVIVATVTYTLQTALYWNGEKIRTATVTTVPGKASEVAYTTESGKQVKEEQLVLAGIIKK